MKVETTEYTLTIGGLTKQEAKDMVESLYGSVMWERTDDGRIISYPRSEKAEIKQNIK